MGKRLITIRINVMAVEDQVTELKAIVNKIEDKHGAGVFQFYVTQNEKKIYDDTFVSSSLDLIKLKVVDELRNIIDGFDPVDSSIIVIEDTHRLLVKTGFRCPNCHRKLFESWGRTKGVVIKCKRCSAIVVPRIQ
jgi:hypothetical protein